MEETEALNWRVIFARVRRLWWLLALAVVTAFGAAYLLAAPGWTASTEVNVGEQPDVSVAAKVLDLPSPILSYPDAGFVGRVKDPAVIAKIHRIAPGARITAARQGTTDLYLLAVGSGSRRDAIAGVEGLRDEFFKLWRADAQSVQAKLKASLAGRAASLQSQLGQVQSDLDAASPASGVYGFLLTDRAKIREDLGKIDAMNSIVDSFATTTEQRGAATPVANSRDRVGFVLTVGAMLAVVLLAAVIAAIVLLEHVDRRLNVRSQVEKLTGTGSVHALIEAGDVDVAIFASVLRRLAGAQPVNAVLVPAGTLSTEGLAERLSRRLQTDGGQDGSVSSAPSFLSAPSEALKAVNSAGQVVLVVETGRTILEDAEYVFKTLRSIDREPHAVVMDGVRTGHLADASR